MLDTRKIRRDFPILQTSIHGKPLIYLDNAATTQKPRQVLDKVHAFYTQSNANIHRGIHHLSERASDAYETARESVKKFINARSAHEIVFTRGATESINLVAQSFANQRVNAGDEILVSGLEHHSNFLPWQALCERKGANLKILPVLPNGALELSGLHTLVTSKTRLIAVTALSNALGTITPAAEIIQLAHTTGIPVLLDSAQAVQHTKTDVQALDCDFLAFSGHKMYSETGIGVLYGKERWLEKMQPCQFGGGMVNEVDVKQTTYADLPFKFEAGTPNFAGAISLHAAIDYLQEIGMETIHGHEQALINHTSRELMSLPGIRVYGDDSSRCGAVSFNIHGQSPYDVCMILDKMGIAVRSGTHCAEPLMKHFGIQGTVRASVALYNTMAEIDSLTDGVKKVQRMLS